MTATPAVLIPWILIAAGGAGGALCRWKLDGAVKATAPEEAPPAPYLGIALVNIIGCLAAGLVVGALNAVNWDCSDQFAALVSTGFLGGFTTFSTAVLDVWDLIEAGRRRTAAVLLIGVWGIGLICAAAGAWAGHALLMGLGGA